MRTSWTLIAQPVPIHTTWILSQRRAKGEHYLPMKLIGSSFQASVYTRALPTEHMTFEEPASCPIFPTVLALGMASATGQFILRRRLIGNGEPGVLFHYSRNAVGWVRMCGCGSRLAGFSWRFSPRRLLGSRDECRGLLRRRWLESFCSKGQCVFRALG